jgi:hypothetical protein
VYHLFNLSNAPTSEFPSVSRTTETQTTDRPLTLQLVKDCVAVTFLRGYTKAMATASWDKVVRCLAAGNRNLP